MTETTDIIEGVIGGSNWGYVHISDGLLVIADVKQSQLEKHIDPVAEQHVRIVASGRRDRPGLPPRYEQVIDAQLT